MAKFELSISADYVPAWGVVEATREFFQNALDEQVVDSSNTMFFDYDPTEMTLRIGNKNSTLDAQTLLFGNSTKTEDNRLIGRFGEGYKIATIVFLRNGKEVTFYNYGSREIWTTRLVKSRKYKGALVPTFFVDKVGYFDSVPEQSLIIEIKGITPDEYALIKESNLHLYEDEGVGKLHATSYGRILLDEKFRGKIFVSGLYVCSNDKLDNGYDFLPECISLDRDRRVVADFDLTWATSRMWSEVKLTAEHLMTIAETFDGSYLHYSIGSAQKDEIVKKFFEQNGTNAVPVSNQTELVKMTKLGFIPILVSENLKSIIKSSSYFEANSTVVVKTLYERFSDFVDKVKDRLDDDELEEIQDILERSRYLLS